MRRKLLNDFTKSERTLQIEAKMQMVFMGIILIGVLIYAMHGDYQALQDGFIH